jgi:UDP-glucose 4-epimerase
MNCLVTGGAGFIGSNLVDELIKSGHDVTVIDNESSDSHENFYWNPKAHNYKYSINDYVMCSDVFKRHNPDVVFHMAAESRIQPCIDDPLKAIETNVVGTTTMLALSKRYKVKRFVFSSTSAAYGLKNKSPLCENMIPDCLNPYSVSKVSGEEICKMYSKLYNLETVIFRYFNVYGERQPVKGQYAPVIGIFQRQKTNNESLTVVGDGEQTRDYVHVNDIVKANIIAANYKDKLNGEIFNVGTGKNYSVNWIANKIQPNPSLITHIPARQGEARDTIADVSKLKNILDWEPSVSLEEWLSDA